MNKEAWIARLKELYKVRNSYQFDLGDHINRGCVAFGRTEAFDAAQQITGTKNTRNFYTRCAAVASLYPASLRFPSLSFATYESLRHFPISFLERFIPEVAPSGRSTKQILHLAIERFGSNPSPHKKRLKRVSVTLKASVYLAALERAKAEKKQTQFWIEQVLTDYLGAETVATQKDAQGAGPTVGNDVPSATTQPEKDAEDESPKRVFRESGTKRKKCTCRIKLLWTECKGRGAHSALRADSFADRDAAEVAQRQYKACHGWTPFISFCEQCSAFHLYRDLQKPNRSAQLSLP